MKLMRLETPSSKSPVRDTDDRVAAEAPPWVKLTQARSQRAAGWRRLSPCTCGRDQDGHIQQRREKPEHCHNADQLTGLQSRRAARAAEMSAHDAPMFDDSNQDSAHTRAIPLDPLP